MARATLTDAQILWDWMWECRTCEFWAGDRSDVLSYGRCKKDDSPCHKEEMDTSGNCSKWDPFDVDLCFRILEDSELMNQASHSTRPRTPEQEAAIRRWEADGECTPEQKAAIRRVKL